MVEFSSNGLNQFFGKGLAVSEKKRRAYFGNNDFPLMVSQYELEDKTIVSHWWKRPDELLQQKINDTISLQELKGLQSVDIVTGSDHGGGRFWKCLKVLFQFDWNHSIKKPLEIANVQHSKDDIDILNQTVLEKIFEGLWLISSENRVIVKLDSNNDKFQLSFVDDSTALICNVLIQQYNDSDMKYFAQI